MGLACPSNNLPHGLARPVSEAVHGRIFRNIAVEIPAQISKTLKYKFIKPISYQPENWLTAKLIC